MSLIEMKILNEFKLVKQSIIISSKQWKVSSLLAILKFLCCIRKLYKILFSKNHKRQKKRKEMIN